MTKLKNLMCPRCGLETLNEVDVRNALSRIDNDTWVCSDCGTEEAFVDAGMMKTREWADQVALLVALLVAVNRRDR